MVNGIVVNGVFINTPGAYGSANFPPSLGNTAPLKNMALLGEFPYLPKAVPLQVTSKDSLDALAPLNLDLGRISSIVYRPSRDERVTGAPSELWLVNVRPTTQAVVDLLDADDAASIRIKSQVWGPKGNQTFITVALSGDVYSITVERDGVLEPYTALKGTSLFSLQYTGSLATVEAASATAGDFVITGSKSAVALGTLPLSGHAWDGPVTVQPSLAADMGKTHMAVVRGYNLETGESDTETLTWNAAAGTTAKETTKSWSKLTSIALSTDDITTPTFTVSGEILRAEPGETPTVYSLANLLSKAPYASVFAVTSVSALAGSIPLDGMDPVASGTDIKTDPVTFKNVKQVLVKALSASTLITAEALTTGGAPVAVADAQLTGGSAGVTQTTDWDDAFTALRQVAVRIIWPKSTQSAIHAKAVTHANHMASAGAYDCNVWCGAAAQETLDQLIARTQALGSRHVSLVGQEIEREGPLGTLEWLGPEYLALLCAAMQASTREAVTYKVPDVVRFRQHASWSPDSDKTAAHNGRITILGRTLDEGNSGQIRVLRALTTFWGSSDPTRTDVRPNESIAELLIFARSYFRTTIGSPTTAPLNVIIREWLALLRRAKALGIISDFDPATVTAVRVGNITTPKARVVPVFSQDFVNVEIGVVPSLTAAAGFELSLAA